MLVHIGDVGCLCGDVGGFTVSAACNAPITEAAHCPRRIRKLSPESKILFLSQESSADVVQEALSLGAWGYVVKAKAASELLAAAEAVLLGRQFVTDT
jgi:DNA-binding NarL/FixJ family response regulator